MIAAVVVVVVAMHAMLLPSRHHGLGDSQKTPRCLMDEILRWNTFLLLRIPEDSAYLAAAGTGAAPRK